MKTLSGQVIHKTGALLLCLLFAVVCAAQTPVLLPHIGVGSLPADSAVVCPIPVYTGGYGSTGFGAGATVPDFTLYTLAGTAVTLSTELQTGQPVLLVAGSYTCPVFRNKMADLNNIASTYASQLKVYVVYTAEAHPIVDPSPYSGTVWVTSQNQQQGVLYRQPTTYGERKAVVSAMLGQLNITTEILLDGPCNNWWSHYGPAPNNAYLIGTDGVVKRRHAWFNKLPDNMYCSIDSLLGTSSGNCNTLANNGAFGFSLTADSVAYGSAGDVLSVHATLTNLSANANAVIDIVRLGTNLPAGWTSALCSDICYGTTVDTIQVTLPPQAAQSFIFYFYTGGTPAGGSATVGFRNANQPGNRYRQRFYGTTQATTGSIAASAPGSSLKAHPNPAAKQVSVTLPDAADLTLTDLSGRVVKQIFTGLPGSALISLDGIPAGVYVLAARTAANVYVQRLVVQ